MNGVAFEPLIAALSLPGIDFARILVLSGGLVITLFCARPIIIAALDYTKVKQPEINDNERKVSAMIGYIERFLTFCFVMDNADNAISMLITAKGIFRIHELGIDGQDGAKENKIHYVMIGTFTSITFAIAVSIVTRFVRDHLGN